MVVSTPSIGLIYKWLSNPTHGIDMNVDGSVTPVRFSYKSPETPLNNRSVISHLNFKIVDSRGHRITRFGGRDELVNGIRVFTTASNDTTELIDFLDGDTIRNNADFTSLVGDTWETKTSSGPDITLADWDLENAGRVCQLRPGQSIHVEVRDDLTDLDPRYFRCMAQGYRLSHDGDEDSLDGFINN